MRSLVQTLQPNCDSFSVSAGLRVLSGGRGTGERLAAIWSIHLKQIESTRQKKYYVPQVCVRQPAATTIENGLQPQGMYWVLADHMCLYQWLAIRVMGSQGNISWFRQEEGHVCACEQKSIREKTSTKSSWKKASKHSWRKRRRRQSEREKNPWQAHRDNGKE